MRIVKQGYRYELDNFNKSTEDEKQIVQFVEPINQINGTTTEELMLVLIDRLTYLDGGKRDPHNIQSINKMKEALYWQTERTKEKKKNANNNIESSSEKATV